MQAAHIFGRSEITSQPAIFLMTSSNSDSVTFAPHPDRPFLLDHPLHRLTDLHHVHRGVQNPSSLNFISIGGSSRLLSRPKTTFDFVLTRLGLSGSWSIHDSLAMSIPYQMYIGLKKTFSPTIDQPPTLIIDKSGMENVLCNSPLLPNCPLTLSLGGLTGNVRPVTPLDRAYCTAI
jgi:hypothetical protein